LGLQPIQTGLIRFAQGAGSDNLIPAGSPAPPLLGGTLSPTTSGNPSPVINDSGDIVFEAMVLGSAVTTFALLRRRADGSVEIVAYAGQAAPGTSGKTFASFGGLSIAADGRATFAATLNDGEIGIYEQSGVAEPVLLALDGQITPVGDGGRFAFFNSDFLFSTNFTKAMNDGTTYVRSAIFGGETYYAEFLGAAGALHTLMTTDDLLPPNTGANLGLHPPTVRKPFVAFLAQRNGGAASIFVRNMESGTTTKLATDGDVLPDSAERLFFVQNLSGTGPTVNSSGQVALMSLTSSGGSAISSVSPAAGLVKIASGGDASPVSGLNFTSFGMPFSFHSAYLNDFGQIAFAAQLSNAQTGVFLYAPGSGITKVALEGEPAPGGSTFSRLDRFTPFINRLGEVQFSDLSGLFLGSAGTTQKIVLAGDLLPDGRSVVGFTPNAFGDDGTVLFEGFTQVMSDLNEGLFLGSPDGTLELLAEIGDPTPAGGQFAPTSVSSVMLVSWSAQRNHEMDIVFRSAIEGGLGDSGLFRRMSSGVAAGTIQTAVIEGQTLPDGIGFLGSIPVPLGFSSSLALGPGGLAAFVNSYFEAGVAGRQRKGAFLSHPNGLLEKLLIPGDAVPGTNGLLSFVSNAVTADSEGGLVLLVNADSGSARQAILFADLAEFALFSTSTSLSSSLNPAVGGQDVTFTAVISSTAGGTPTGLVRFLDGPTEIGSAMLSAGQAQFSLDTLPVGSHSITAQYSGDATFATSTSSALTQEIKLAGFAPPPAQIVVQAGQSVTIPLTLFAAPGSGMSFSLSVSGVPANSSATFSPNPVTPAAPPNGTTVQLTLSTRASSLGAPRMPRRPQHFLIWLAVLLATTALAPVLVKRYVPSRRLAFTSGLATVLLASAFLGCAGDYSSDSPNYSNPPLGTPKGTSTLTVTAVSGGTSVATQVSVLVQ
jgi:hypothetical protein